MGVEAYRQLEAQQRRIGVLDGISSVLGWDRSVMMPDGGAPARGEQLALLSVLAHEFVTAPERGDLIAAAQEHEDELDAWQRANLSEISHSYKRATALAPDLVERLALAASDTEFAWRRAREDNDFAAVAGKLDGLLALVREEAAALGGVLNLAPYDALLDGYDRGLRRAHFAEHFDDLARVLPPLLDRVLEVQGTQGAALPLPGPFPVARQEALSRALVERLGFDFGHGRLDVSHHPFSSGGPGDARMTTRYEEGEFVQALMATVHETGHSLYTLGQPAQWRYQPVGAARGMVLHESQSLSLEMQLARSPSFLSFLAPFAAEYFAGTGPAWSVENVRKHVHQVSRGLIRVFADEVTYPLHVILRFKLEQQLIDGTLNVGDLPEAWRDAMRTHLGVVPENDRQGCLQDIHWYSGAFGYFPTYTLGAMAAAQLFAAAVRECAEIMSEASDGRAGTLLGWMRRNVHERGASCSTQEILQDATGERLGTAAFIAHLRARYLGAIET